MYLVLDPIFTFTLFLGGLKYEKVLSAIRSKMARKEPRRMIANRNITFSKLSDTRSSFVSELLQTEFFELGLLRKR